jgi:hypothetical protein
MRQSYLRPVAAGHNKAAGMDIQFIGKRGVGKRHHDVYVPGICSCIEVNDPGKTDICFRNKPAKRLAMDPEPPVSKNIRPESASIKTTNSIFIAQLVKWLSVAIP